MRSLTFVLAATLAGATSAQYPYNLTLSGTISNCYPGQTVNIQTVQGTQPAYNFDVLVDSVTCTWSTQIGLTSTYAWYTVNTMCNGNLVTAGGMEVFTTTPDSASFVIPLSCGGVPDCVGIPGGPNVPGSICGNCLGEFGIWSMTCICEVDTNLNDCLGFPGGPALPGTACNDGDTLTVQDAWTLACQCVGVTINYYDCLQILNGPNLPGTPCDDGDPVTINDTWDANCACVGGNTTPCEADFWVLQGFTVDTLNNPTPIPYELWVWNLSSGGSGTYSTFWSFGDGTSSTAQFPTHTYSGNGPYWLCLTIDDGAGCQSTHCDSVSIDSNGLYTGIMGGGNDRQNGFTINVQDPGTTGITEASVADGIAAWPNPVVNELNIAVTNAVSGTADVTVLDLNGRVVMADRRMLANGRNQLLLQTSALSPGLYTVRISNGSTTISQRFVKAN